MIPFILHHFLDPELEQSLLGEPQTPCPVTPRNPGNRDNADRDDHLPVAMPTISVCTNDGLPDSLAWARPRPPLWMLQTAYLDIMKHLGSVPPEAGGMLLGPEDSPVVTHYVPDHGGKATAVSFTLNAAELNRILKKALACRLNCKGFVHSHPVGCTQPSSGDLAYVRKSFANEKNKNLVEFPLPIYCEGVLIPYIVRPRDAIVVQMAQLILI